METKNRKAEGKNKCNATASNLKYELWDTLKELKAGKIGPEDANSVSGVAREILRTCRMEYMVATAEVVMPRSLSDFVEEE